MIWTNWTGRSQYHESCTEQGVRAGGVNSDLLIASLYAEINLCTVRFADPVSLQDKEKTGVFTGTYAINPINGAKVPIWLSDYVLADYGTGAIMCVPAHDDLDFEFAKKFNIPIQSVCIFLTFSGQSSLSRSFKRRSAYAVILSIH